MMMTIACEYFYLESGINVGPMFINFVSFSRPMAILKHRHLLNVGILSLFVFANFPGPTFIPCPPSIPDSRVSTKTHS